MLKTIPRNLISQFTMNYKVCLVYKKELRDDSNPDFSFHTKELLEKWIEQAKKRIPNYYGQTDTFLFDAFDTYPIKDKNVIIYGSVKPWYEAVSFAYNAKSVSVIEYNKPTLEYPNLQYLSPDTKIKADIILSISSFEHDGLGRYGDPISPVADLKAMKDARAHLRLNGLMFLAVPVGIDTLVWNLHRIYGIHRLPVLCSAWKVIDTFGYHAAKLKEFSEGGQYQPVFVLEK